MALEKFLKRVQPKDMERIQKGLEAAAEVYKRRMGDPIDDVYYEAEGAFVSTAMLDGEAIASKAGRLPFGKVIEEYLRTKQVESDNK